MSLAAFPLGKVVILAVKHASKPVSNAIKKGAKAHPVIKQYMCIPPAQLYNSLEARSKLLMLNIEQPKKVPRLNDEQAIELGANLLGEIFVIALGLYLLYFEVSRQNLKDEKKKQALEEEQEQLDKQVNALLARLDYQSQELNFVKQQIHKFGY